VNFMEKRALIGKLLVEEMPDEWSEEEKLRWQQKIFLNHHDPDRDYREDYRALVGTLYDGLAYGNWPWSPKTVDGIIAESKLRVTTAVVDENKRVQVIPHGEAWAVVYRGAMTTPRFTSQGAAQAYAQMILDGRRRPELG
jgi:hypothetical protein